MNANQLLRRLDYASMTAPSADARRMIANEAGALRVRLQRAQQLAGLRKNAKECVTENGRAMYRQQVEDFGEVEVLGQMAEAARVLRMWERL